MIELPVSNITVSTYGGEPKAISPTYYWSFIFFNEIPYAAVCAKLFNLLGLKEPYDIGFTVGSSYFFVFVSSLSILSY